MKYKQFGCTITSFILLARPSLPAVSRAVRSVGALDARFRGCGDSEMRLSSSEISYSAPEINKGSFGSLPTHALIPSGLANVGAGSVSSAL